MKKYFVLVLLMCSFVQANVPTDSTQRFSSYPLISGDTFRAFCDFVFDETNMPLDPSKVIDGSTIFVNGDVLDRFFLMVHPHIHAKYILVSHNSDHWVPASYAHYLEDEHIIAWFGQNIDREHPKLHALPIGIANSHWPHGNCAVFTTEISNAHSIIKRTDRLAYLNFKISTNPTLRAPVWNFFVQKDFCLVSEPNKDLRSYLREMVTCVFAISPPGNGIDCHRTWEALYMGTIPIVKASAIGSLYDDLPIVVVNDWAEVTRAFLMEKYTELNKQYNKEKIYADYWFEKINCVKRDYLNR